MTSCNGKGVACRDEPTENKNLTLQLPPALLRVLVSFNSLFWFNGPQLNCVIRSHRSHLQHCQSQQAAVFSKKR